MQQKPELQYPLLVIFQIKVFYFLTQIKTQFNFVETHF